MTTDRQTRRSWNQVECEVLRICFRVLTLRELASCLKRSYLSVKTKALRLGLVRQPRWTEGETHILRELYGRVPGAEIARQLGRSSTQIYGRATRVGLARVYPGRHRHPGFGRYVRDRHAEGWTDREIAADWRTERHQVSRVRRRLGLASNAYGKRQRLRVAEATRRQCAAAGVASLAEVRAKVFRDRARAAGWPEDLRPRAVQILNMLWTRGPMTRRELAEAIGLPWRGSRKSLASNDPEGSYLAHLMKRGLVVCLGRVVRGRGRGRSVNLYTLPLDIERREPA